MQLEETRNALEVCAAAEADALKREHAEELDHMKAAMAQLEEAKTVAQNTADKEVDALKRHHLAEVDALRRELSEEHAAHTDVMAELSVELEATARAQLEEAKHALEVLQQQYAKEVEGLVAELSEVKAAIVDVEEAKVAGERAAAEEREVLRREVKWGQAWDMVRAC